MLPPQDAQGRLPIGRHVCTLEDLRTRFVDEAPHAQPERARIWGAFAVYVDLVRRRIPGAVLWINGGFVTHKTDPPSDIDIVIVHPPGWNPTSPEERDEVLTLLTLQGGALLSEALSADGARVSPMGGLVDGFLASRDDAAQLAYWENMWGGVKEAQDTRKGYVEVKL